MFLYLASLPEVISRSGLPGIRANLHGCMVTRSCLLQKHLHSHFTLPSFIAPLITIGGLYRYLHPRIRIHLLPFWHLHLSDRFLPPPAIVSACFPEIVRLSLGASLCGPIQ